MTKEMPSIDNIKKEIKTGIEILNFEKDQNIVDNMSMYYQAQIKMLELYVEINDSLSKDKALTPIEKPVENTQSSINEINRTQSLYKKFMNIFSKDAKKEVTIIPINNVESNIYRNNLISRERTVKLSSLLETKEKYINIMQDLTQIFPKIRGNYSDESKAKLKNILVTMKEKLESTDLYSINDVFMQEINKVKNHEIVKMNSKMFNFSINAAKLISVQYELNREKINDLKYTALEIFEPFNTEIEIMYKNLPKKEKTQIIEKVLGDIYLNHINEDETLAKQILNQLEALQSKRDVSQDIFDESGHIVSENVLKNINRFRKQDIEDVQDAKQIGYNS